MNLATFDSYNEGVYFDGVSKYSTWIGVRDNLMNGQFVGVTDGKDIKRFVPWRPGQPSGHEYCVHSWDGHNFNDLPCNSHLRFACETVE